MPFVPSIIPFFHNSIFSSLLLSHHLSLCHGQVTTVGPFWLSLKFCGEFLKGKLVPVMVGNQSSKSFYKTLLLYNLFQFAENNSRTSKRNTHFTDLRIIFVMNQQPCQNGLKLECYRTFCSKIRVLELKNIVFKNSTHALESKQETY
jgi:hypothetical protein